jgi:hypothetical protein
VIRTKPLARGAGFKRKDAPPRREAKQTTSVARARPVAVFTGEARAVVPVPKTAYVRDERLRAMCQAMRCQACGAWGVSDWAHSNQGRHGKGKGIKASDVYVAAMCWPCHSRLDQGSDLTEPERVVLWEQAHARTLYLALRTNTWPPGVTMPTLHLQPCGAYALDAP